MEFFYLEPNVVKSQTVQEFINIVKQQKEQLGVKEIVPYSEAVKFKAHNRIEWI